MKRIILIALVLGLGFGLIKFTSIIEARAPGPEPGSTAGPLAVSLQAAATLRADYQLQFSLSSSTGSSPRLTDLGSTTFQTDTVDGFSRTVLRFAENDGLQLSPTTGVIPNDRYTIVILFKFERVDGFRRVVDFKNGTSDFGAYVQDGRLKEGGGNVPPNTYVQIVYTRDGSIVSQRGYINGELVLEGSGATSDWEIDGSNTLRFFRDDDVFPGEASAGAVARIRLYDGPLTASQVAALDRLPGAFPPLPGTNTFCSNVPVSIPDGGRVASRLVVDRDLFIEDMNVRLFISHTNDEDLEVALFTPDGSPAKSPGLFPRLVGGDGDNFGSTCSPLPDCIFDDEATVLITRSNPPFVGRFRTIDLRNVERTNARGTWTLGIVDRSGGGTGTLNCWCMEIQPIPPQDRCLLREVTGESPIFSNKEVVAGVNSNGVPAQNVPVDFEVRGIRGEIRLQVQIRTDSFGEAKLVYSDSVAGPQFVEARTTINGVVHTCTTAVTWTIRNICPVLAVFLPASQGEPRAEATVNMLRRFRDEELAKTPRGQRYTQLYYQFSSEPLQIMMFNPMLILRSREIIERYKPVVQSMVDGQGATLTKGDLDEIEGFLNSFAAKGSPELQNAIKGVCEDLRDPSMHSEFRITVTDGPKRDLPVSGRLQSMKRLGVISSLLGFCAAFAFGLTGRHRKVVRRNAKRILVIVLALAGITNWFAPPGYAVRRQPVIKQESSASAPSGAVESSPAIHRWESEGEEEESPVGTAERIRRPFTFDLQSSLQDSKGLSIRPPSNELLGYYQKSLRYALRIAPKVGERLPTQPSTDPATTQRQADAYGKLPLAFEVNQGQTDSQVKFLSRGRDHGLFLTPTEAVLAFRQRQKAKGKREKGGIHQLPTPSGLTTDHRPLTTDVLRMKLVGANPAPQMAGLDQLPAVSNYFVGNDPTKWRPSVPTYARVKYQDVYPGVDMVYYGNQRELEYDFMVAPGADPRAITLGFEGANKVEVDRQGDLVVHTAGGEVRQRKPVVYQTVNGMKRNIPARYALYEMRGQDSHGLSTQHSALSTSHVGFEIGAYDTSRPLIIDPVLVYSTYLGGSGDDEGNTITVDSAGNAYVVGFTNSINFPLSNAAQPSLGGGLQDAFVAKLNPSGTALVYSTYLGGDGQDNGSGIAVDSAGNAYVAGFTGSANFPVLNPLQPTSGGPFNAFVAKLNPTGGLLYSTFLGGSVGDFGSSITLDSSGNMYVAGVATSPNFPMASAIQPALGGAADVYVAKLNPSGTQLVYSTYLGGTDNDGATSIAVDPAGNLYVTGVTSSPNFRTASPTQAAHGGGLFDAFVAKLNPSGSQLVYSTYLGGSREDRGFRIAADSAGNAYVTGDTDSPNFPTASALQQTNGGSVDTFIAKLNPSGTALTYSTYLGGSGIDGGTAIAVDAAGSAYVTGFTSSTNFPTAAPLQQAFGGGDFDGFVAKLNTAGSLDYSTYLGGSGIDSGFGIAVDSGGNAYVMGVTDSFNFPTATPLQPANGGGTSDLFIAKIKPDLRITSAMVSGKKLFVSGSGFDNGAKILLNGQTQKSANDLQNPTTTLIGKKAGKKIGRGQTVTLQVRNSDGTLSNEFSFTRPAG